MVFRFFFIAILFCLKIGDAHNHNGSQFTVMKLSAHVSFNAVTSSPGPSCHHGMLKNTTPTEEDDDKSNRISPVKLHLKHRSSYREIKIKESVTESTFRDLSRIQTLSTRIMEKKNQNKVSRMNKRVVLETKSMILQAAIPENRNSGQLMATLESGVSLGSGEYFIDVFIGTPPKHFSLILDTGSDLNWIQSVPCYDCFEQNGPYYNPKDSASFRNISCHDPRCQLVSLH